MAKAYRSLAQRQADRASVELAQAKVSIAKLAEVERLEAKVLALRVPSVDEGAVAPDYSDTGKPIRFSMWKRFLSTSLVTGYVLDTLADTVQVYCVHCGLPTDVSVAKPIAIGVISTYDETVVEFSKATMSWDEQDVERIRPAIHKGMGCVSCYLAYTKAVANAKRLRTRIRYSVNGIRKTLYAANISHGASLLAEQMGRVELLECKQIPERQGFLNIAAKVRAFAKGVTF